MSLIWQDPNFLRLVAEAEEALAFAKVKLHVLLQEAATRATGTELFHVEMYTAFIKSIHADVRTLLDIASGKISPERHGPSVLQHAVETRADYFRMNFDRERRKKETVDGK